MSPASRTPSPRQPHCRNRMLTLACPTRLPRHPAALLSRVAQPGPILASRSLVAFRPASSVTRTPQRTHTTDSERSDRSGPPHRLVHRLPRTARRGESWPPRTLLDCAEIRWHALFRSVHYFLFSEAAGSSEKGYSSSANSIAIRVLTHPASADTLSAAKDVRRREEALCSSACPAVPGDAMPANPLPCHRSKVESPGKESTA